MPIHPSLRRAQKMQETKSDVILSPAFSRAGSSQRDEPHPKQIQTYGTCKKVRRAHARNFNELTGCIPIAF